MVRVIARILSIRLGEWPGFVHTVVVLLVIELGLRTTNLDRLAGLLGLSLDSAPSTAAQSGPHFDGREAAALRTSQKVLRHWIFPPTCLRRSLLAGHVLRRHHPLLRVGVAKIDGVVTAHAWLEIEGVNLDPGGSAQFEVLSMSTPAKGRSL